MRIACKDPTRRVDREAIQFAQARRCELRCRRLDKNAVKRVQGMGRADRTIYRKAELMQLTEPGGMLPQVSARTKSEPEWSCENEVRSVGFLKAHC